MRGAYIVLALGVALGAHAADAITRVERGNLVLENVPAPDPQLSDRLDAWQAIRGASFIDFLPDGGMLVSTRFGEVEQLHRVAGPGQDRQQLTFYREPVTGARVARGEPHGVAFLKDFNGDENSQLYFYSFGRRSATLLTDNKSLNGSPVWSRDGKRLAWYSNARDPQVFDVVMRDFAGDGVTRVLLAGELRTYYPIDWSPDGRKLLLWNPLAINDSRLFVFDLADKSLQELDAVAAVGKRPLEPVAISSARFAADGQGVYLISDRDSEFAQLRYIEIGSTEPSRSLTAHVPWDVEQFDLSADGRYLVFTANEDGYSRLQVLDLLNSQDLVLPPMPRGLIANPRFDASGRTLGMTLSGTDRPRDAWTLDLGDNRLTRWTHSETGPIEPQNFIAARTVRFASFDAIRRRQPRMIPALMYLPPGAGPHPVIIDIHGGPEGQTRPGFDATTQFLVAELGLAVIAPNVRGSSGYGKSFMRLDDGYLRENAVKDIGALLDWIALQPNLDAKRVFVMGASYGGYMALASLAAYNERLRGGVDIVGISDFVTFLETTAGYRQDLRRAEYGDERDPLTRQFLREISPRTRANKIRRPLLIVQGLNDPRVPASESEQMVAAIRANGGEVWYVAAKDEGHGFRKKANRDAYLNIMADFLRRLAATP